MDQNLVSRPDLQRQNVPWNLGREGNFAGIALRRVLGHKQCSAACDALDRAEETATAPELCMRVHGDGLGHPAKLACLGDQAFARL